jgi:hypothetical protein
MTKSTRSNWATQAKVPAIPPNPNIAAITAITRNRIANPSMIYLLTPIHIVLGNPPPLMLTDDDVWNGPLFSGPPID